MKHPKILYAINGTGLGHISRAKALIPYLKQHAEIELLISGKRTDLIFDHEIKYCFKGFTFVYDKGGVNWFKTIKNSNPISFVKDVLSLDISIYDAVLSDFEPISAWASILKKKKCINVSHQASFYSPNTPRPKPYFLYTFQEIFMRYFANTKDYIGIHYKSYDKNIINPLIKDDILKAKTKTLKHITVYLSAISVKKQINIFLKFPEHQFEVFHSKCKTQKKIKNITLSPLSESFKKSLINSSGYISQAGFESTSEALFLQKPLLAIPIKNQYEQKCNASALKELGASISKNLNFQTVDQWIHSKQRLKKNSSCKPRSFS